MQKPRGRVHDYSLLQTGGKRVYNWVKDGPATGDAKAVEVKKEPENAGPQRL